MLSEIKRLWKSWENNRLSAALDPSYKIYVLMTTIERLMVKLPPHANGYGHLQQCINLLDECDLALETFAIQQIASS